MADGKIFITISTQEATPQTPITPTTPDTPTTPETPDTPVNPVTPKPKETEEEKKKRLFAGYVEHQALHFIEAQVSQAINQSISNIGNFTGDYQAQRDAQATLQMLNTGKGILMSTIAGAKVGGVIGAGIGAAVGIASSMINYGYQQKAESARYQKQNYSINQLRDLSGLNTLTNGSR